MAENCQRAYRGGGKTERYGQVLANKETYKVELLELKVQQLEESLKNSEERLREEKTFNANLRKVYEDKMKEKEIQGIAEHQAIISNLREENDKLKKQMD